MYTEFFGGKKVVKSSKAIKGENPCHLMYLNDREEENP